MKNVLKKYSGKYVAWVNNKIVASGKSQLEIYKKAKKIYPSEMVSLEYVPTKRETELFL